MVLAVHNRNSTLPIGFRIPEPKRYEDETQRETSIREGRTNIFVPCRDELSRNGRNKDGLRTEHQGFDSQQGARFFSSSQRPDRLWDGGGKAAGA
jgi:hypothetical protein